MTFFCISLPIFPSITISLCHFLVFKKKYFYYFLIVNPLGILTSFFMWRWMNNCTSVSLPSRYIIFVCLPRVLRCLYRSYLQNSESTGTVTNQTFLHPIEFISELYNFKCSVMLNRFWQKNSQHSRQKEHQHLNVRDHVRVRHVRANETLGYQQ